MPLALSHQQSDLSKILLMIKTQRYQNDGHPWAMIIYVNQKNFSKLYFGVNHILLCLSFP